MTRRRRVIVVVAVVVAVLASARIALPHVLENWVNGRLQSMGDYTGRVAEIDVHLLRGAYVLRGLIVEKLGADIETPFLDLARMDISLQWGALFDGELVGEIVAHSPVLNLVQGPSDADSQLGKETDWPAEVRQLFPFNFNRFEVEAGQITFRAPGIESDESLTLDDTYMLLQNVTNVAEETDEAFADIELRGHVMGQAPLSLTGRINPTEDLPTFDLNFSLEGARLVEVNPWLREFIHADAESGVFSMFAELAAADGNFEGYVRPILDGAELYESGEEASGPFRRAWEILADFAANIFTNRETDQLATQIPLSGEIENPEAGTLAAIVNLLRNAFVAAFSRSIEGSISLRDVEQE